MGIKGLFPFLTESAPLAIKETKVEAMTGRAIAIDASMCLYQFLVAVRQGEAQSNLSNASGEVTSSLEELEFDREVLYRWPNPNTMVWYVDGGQLYGESVILLKT